MRLKFVCLAIGVFIALSETTAPASDVVHYAASFIGRPYVWGAEGPNSFDCSGLTQYVFREFAVDLPRRAVSQAKAGDPTGRGLQRGDLVFFSDDTRRTLVTHVGIYEGSGRMIEASKRAGRVRRSNLNDAFYVERFMGARRVMGGTQRPEIVRDRRGREEDTAGGSSSRKRAVRNAAMRALEELAGALIRRQRR
jgi:hypothetical protein